MGRLENLSNKLHGRNGLLVVCDDSEPEEQFGFAKCLSLDLWRLRMRLHWFIKRHLKGN